MACLNLLDAIFEWATRPLRIASIDCRRVSITESLWLKQAGCVKFGRCDNLINCPGHLEGIKGYTCARKSTCPRNAGVAQSVEHLICNQGVRGSNPFASSSIRRSVYEDQVAKVRKRTSGRQRNSRWRNRFFQRTSFGNIFGNIPACSDLRAVILKRDSWFP